MATNELQQLEFTPESVRDFIKIFSMYTPEGVVDVINACVPLLPFIEQADAPDGERAAIVAFEQRLARDHICFHVQCFTCLVLSELCHYPPQKRGPFLYAALAAATGPADKEHSLRAIHPLVLAAIRNLDARTKAILAALEELSRVAGDVNGIDYPNDIPDQLDDANIDILRSEPDLAPIVQAYDLANAILSDG